MENVIGNHVQNTTGNIGAHDGIDLAPESRRSQLGINVHNRVPEEGGSRNGNSGVEQRRVVQPAYFANEVDSWIDDLDENRSCSSLGMQMDGINANMLMSSLVQQFLPQVDIPKFSGAALEWVEFIVTFRDVVHNQQYLNDRQRNQQLLQHLLGEAKASVKDYANDPRGYVLSLKKIKYLFGQRYTVTKAILDKVLKGKPVANNDVNGLSKLYYDVGSCLITLRQLNYASDLYSSDTLSQAVKRLPQHLVIKWAERSMYIRAREEPSLVHFGEWLKQRVLVMREVADAGELKGKGHGTSLINTLLNQSKHEHGCRVCKGNHAFWKCNEYKGFDASKKFELVKGLDLCMNCFKPGHKKDGCTSENKCLKEGCGKKHHASLHAFFVKRDEMRKAARAKKKALRENGRENGGDEQINGDVAVMHCAMDEPVAEEEGTSINAIRSRPT